MPKRATGRDGRPKAIRGDKQLKSSKARKQTISEAAPLILGHNFDPRSCVQYTDSLMILKEHLAQFPVFTENPINRGECDCELRYAKSIVEETFDRIQDGTVRTSQASHKMASVLLCQNTTNYTEEQLLVLAPGIMIIPKPLVLMSVIQLKRIQYRLQKLILTQKPYAA